MSEKIIIELIRMAGAVVLSAWGEVVMMRDDWRYGGFFLNRTAYEALKPAFSSEPQTGSYPQSASDADLRALSLGPSQGHLRLMYHPPPSAQT